MLRGYRVEICLKVKRTPGQRAERNFRRVQNEKEEGQRRKKKQLLPSVRVTAPPGSLRKRMNIRQCATRQAPAILVQRIL